MSNLPAGFYEGELYCFSTGPARDNSFAVIPGPPTVELNQGRLAIDLMDVPDGAVFSLQCVWQVDPQVLERARAAIAARYPDASEITLDVAELRDVQATLSIADADDTPHVIGPRPASGSAANRVVFSETLAGARKAAVARALGGDADILSLRYAGSLILQETVAVEIQGDLAATLKSLAPKPQEQRQGLFGKKKPPAPPVLPTLEACATAVDHAIMQGQLRVTSTATANVSQQACDDAVAALRAQLANMLADKIVQLGADAAYLTSFPVMLKHATPEQMQFDITRSADLGVWARSNGHVA